MKKRYLFMVIIFGILIAIGLIAMVVLNHEKEKREIESLVEASPTPSAQNNSNTPVPTQVFDIQEYNPKESIDPTQVDDEPKGAQTYTEDEVPTNDIYLKDAYEIYEDGLLDQGVEHLLPDIRTFLDSKEYKGLKALVLVPNTILKDSARSISFILKIDGLDNKYIKVCYDIAADHFDISEYEYHEVKPLTDIKLSEMEKLQDTYKTKYEANFKYDKKTCKQLINLVSAYANKICSEKYYEIYHELLATDELQKLIPYYDEFTALQDSKQFRDKWNPSKEERIYSSVAMYYKFDSYYLVKMGYQYTKNGKKGPCCYKWVTVYENNGTFKLLPNDITCKNMWLSQYQ